ncbi:MAG: sugar nucleotide-binding protein [Chitinispirillaceae bacterium]|nr:sugar nucleotide-binding protein [Chitinispirillaceae bacterium]
MINTTDLPISTISLHHERILVTGITGIHGWPVYQALSRLIPQEKLFGIGPPRMKNPSGRNVKPLCISDVKNLRQIRDVFKPTLVIHAGGVCDLDVCEERPRWAHRINVDGSSAVAETFSGTARTCYLSTDLVYSGNNPPSTGYAEHHRPNPLSIAGKTLQQGEQAIMTAGRWAIIRLGLPVGASVTGDKGGLDWIESRFRRNLPVTLFTDEYRSIISCGALARSVIEFAGSRTEGIYHLGGSRTVSLYELGGMIIEGGKYAPSLLKGITRSQERDGPPRIGNVGLNSGKIASLLSHPVGTWRYCAS